MIAAIGSGWRGFRAAVAGRPLRAIFLLALTLRLAYGLGLYAAMGADGLMLEDSPDYLGAGQMLLDHGALVQETPEGLRPETRYMPLYPAFVALFLWLGGGPLGVVIGQALIDSLTCLLIARIALRLDAGLALPAGLFAAVNPTQIVIAGLVLTDTLFLMCCALALLAAVEWLRRPDWRWAVVLGVALGLGLFTRAMLLPWVFALPVLLAAGAAWRRRLGPAAIAQLTAALALCLAIQAPVVARNHAHFDTIALTSQGGVHVMLWLAPLAMEAKTGIAHAEAAATINQRYRAAVEAETNAETGAEPFRQSRAMAALGFQVIGEMGAAALAKAYAIGAAINLGAPAAVLSPPLRQLPRTGFYATPGATKLEKISAFLFHNDNRLYGWVLLLGVAGVALCRLIQLRGLARALRAGPETRLAVLLLLLWIGFILAVNGPIASAKYRLPAEPAFAVLMALGLARRLNPGNGNVGRWAVKSADGDRRELGP